MKICFSVLFLLILIGTGCHKSITDRQIPDSSLKDSNILVDASKDGGVWWSPQSGPGDHQGYALAEYLRSLGFHLDELPQGAVITDSLLKKYSKIIRCATFFQYSDDELAAYKNFLHKTNNIDAPIMGILNNYPNTKIFFLGDENGVEYVPQPFTQNLVSWLFE